MPYVIDNIGIAHIITKGHVPKKGYFIAQIFTDCQQMINWPNIKEHLDGHEECEICKCKHDENRVARALGVG